MRPMEEVLALQSYAQAEAGTNAPCFSWASVRETRALAPVVGAVPAEPNGGR